MSNLLTKITVNYKGKRQVLETRQGRRLKELISDAGISLDLPCGGIGRCGRCKVKFLSGAPLANYLDMCFLSKEEIAGGVRLLCRCILDGDAEILLDDHVLFANDAESGMAIETVSESAERTSEAEDRKVKGKAVAVDIGTTTIAMALIYMYEDSSFAIKDTVSGMNHQREFGADVISRIQAAADLGKAAELRSCIQKDVEDLLGELLKRNSEEKLDGICIVGNTTMLHLFRGFDVSGLGQYPYHTEHLSFEDVSFSDAFGGGANASLEKEMVNTKVYILPGISAFVGADIVAGIYELDMTNRGAKVLLMDLGTNGEIAYYSGDKLLVTSTAAGPVFEGGGISCGTASVNGAISHIAIKNDGGKLKTEYETIGGKSPIGICGTGVLEAVAELVRCKIVDHTGLLSEEYFEKGFPIAGDGADISFTQQDIRSVQLAKAAIFVGQQELTKGETPEVIYVSGGFGTHIDPGRVGKLGLFYGDCLDIRAVGNTALKGAIKYMEQVLISEDSKEAADKEILRIVEMAEELVLASESSFGEKYMEAMNF